VRWAGMAGEVFVLLAGVGVDDITLLRLFCRDIWSGIIAVFVC
jgi:hypothetical protein